MPGVPAQEPPARLPVICDKAGECDLQDYSFNEGQGRGRSVEPRRKLHKRKSLGDVIVLDEERCILCSRCVRFFEDVTRKPQLTVSGLGSRSVINTFMDKPLADVICINCGQCINRCPTGALHANDSSDDIWRAIDHPAKHVVIQTAPSPRAGIGECFGCEPGTPMTYQMNTALRLCGFDKVFDANFTADLTAVPLGSIGPRPETID